MNMATLMGRLTRDPEIRYSGETKIANFDLAIDRPPRKDGTKETDYPRCVAFGKTADIVERYCRKGGRVTVQGRIQTGRYENKNGDTVYTTDIVAERVEIIDWPEQDRQASYPQDQQTLRTWDGPIGTYSGGFGQPGVNAQPQQTEYPGTYSNPFEGDPGYQYGKR